jgi:hypothetical protein
MTLIIVITVEESVEHFVNVFVIAVVNERPPIKAAILVGTLKSVALCERAI